MTIDLDFSTIQNQYRFEIDVDLVTPLHIGGSQEDAISSDNPIIRDANNHPYIPGSSIKGLMRSASERVAHLLDIETKKEVCFLEGSCEPHKHKEIEQLESEKELFDYLYGELCPVCQTYGGGSIASKVKFNHIVLGQAYKTRVRTSNSIDRETGAVKDGMLFNYEYIQPDQSIKIIIEAENMSDTNLKVLAGALVQLQQNMLRLGGKQAKGLGQLAFKEGQVFVKEFDSRDKKKALSLLLGKAEPEQLGLQQFLEKYL